MDRLGQYMVYAGLNDNRLTVLSGMTVGILNSARKRGKGMSSDNLEKILRVCKDLNARWLLTGEGEMLGSEPVVHSPDALQILKEQNKELMEKIAELSRELGDKERQLAELKKGYVSYGMVADRAEGDSYGSKK